MDLGGISWGLQTIVGAALLAIVLFWAMLRNKAKSKPEDIERTERATRELYRQEDEAHKGEDDRVP